MGPLYEGAVALLSFGVALLSLLWVHSCPRYTVPGAYYAGLQVALAGECADEASTMLDKMQEQNTGSQAFVSNGKCGHVCSVPTNRVVTTARFPI